jgi:hypothetical protein
VSDTVTLYRAIAHLASNGDADPRWKGRWHEDEARALAQARRWDDGGHQDVIETLVERWRAELVEPPS